MNVKDMSWQEHQAWEAAWHEDCINSYREESKQIVYSKKMGLEPITVNWKYPTYDLKGKSVLDIGGGPYSLLLKTINGKDLTIIDPCDYPSWVYSRYDTKGIKVIKGAAEDISSYPKAIYDEVWIYNLLQHVQDPAAILKNARAVSKVIRIFDWIDRPPSPGHPQELKEDKLNEWLMGVGKVEEVSESGAVGKAYFGIFKGNYYA